MPASRATWSTTPTNTVRASPSCADTADWFANASRSELDLGGRKTAATVQLAHNPARYNVQAAATYVTGSHNIKVGFQRTWGTFTHSYDANADLTQQYRSNSTGLPYTVPNSVVIRNTPLTDFGERLNYDLGIFAQDSWTMRRLTINAGIRWEALNAQVLEGNSPAGRFVPARHFDAIENLPNWRDWAPRFSAVYDLRGDAKTAVKFSLNRYNQQRTTGIADSYNALVSATSSSLAWTDLNRDDIAQGARDCVYLTAPGARSISRSCRRTSATRRSTATATSRERGISRAPIELQHELLPRLSVSGSLVPRDVPQPDEHLSHRVDVCGLHADQHLQPDDRHADHGLQPERRGQQPAGRHPRLVRSRASADLQQLFVRVQRAARRPARESSAGCRSSGS